MDVYRGTHKLVALALWRSQEARAVPLWPGAVTSTDRDCDSLPLHRGDPPGSCRHDDPLVVGSISTRAFLAGLLLIAPVYVTVRTTNIWSGRHAVDLANTYLGADRAESLGYRFQCETLLITKGRSSSHSSDGAGLADLLFISTVNQQKMGGGSQPTACGSSTLEPTD